MREAFFRQSALRKPPRKQERDGGGVERRGREIVGMNAVLILVQERLWYLLMLLLYLLNVFDICLKV